MKLRAISWATLSLLMSAPAMAAITCNVTVTPISTVYSPTVATENISVGSYTVNCNRTLLSDANTTFSLGANNGIHFTGAQNRGQLAATTNRYNYEIYRVTTYTNANRWQDTSPTRFTGSVIFSGTNLAATTVSAPFYLRVPGSQTVRPAGDYTDTVTVTLRIPINAAAIADTNSFPVTIVTTNSCQVSTLPGPLVFTYSSFQTTTATASTSFAARCTTGLPYAVSFNAATTLLGLNYDLTASPTNPTGTGIAQNITINGSIASGQAGTCPTGACSSSQSRSVVLTY